MRECSICSFIQWDDNSSCGGNDDVYDDVDDDDDDDNKDDIDDDDDDDDIDTWAIQGNYWYHFYNVFVMTRSLSGD